MNEGLAIARSQSTPWPTGAGLVRLAKLAMVHADYDNAIALLQESLPVIRSIERLDEVGDALISLGARLILVGKTGQAIAHLIEGKRIADDIDHFTTKCHGIAASALLSRAQGNAEQAMEWTAVAASRPFVANSRWFDDVYSQELTKAPTKCQPISEPPPEIE